MAYDFKNISVLVAEDNPPMLDLVCSLLHTFGVKTVHRAINGQKAYAMFVQEKPDVIIADWMMRPEDGISLTRRIRNDPGSPNKYVPIILMTGFSEKRRVIQARDAGITEFLAKPFNVRELYRRLYEIIEHPRQFVNTAEFFGPDRRRRTLQSYTGPLKRITDIQPDDYR